MFKIFQGVSMLDFVGGYPYSGPTRPFMGPPRYFLVGSQHRRWGDSRWKSRRVELAAQNLQGPFKIKVVSWSIQNMNTKMDFGDLEQRFQWTMFKSPNMYKFQISSKCTSINKNRRNHDPKSNLTLRLSTWRPLGHHAKGVKAHIVSVLGSISEA